jgi:hypothetical protein
MSNQLEKLSNDFKSLTQSIKEFKSFSTVSKNRYIENLTQRLDPLIKKIQKKIQSPITYQITDSNKVLDLALAWQAYLNNPNPSQSEIRSMIQKGLNERGLESNQEFKNFLERQDDRRAQAKLFRNLYKYLIKVLALRKNPIINNFWIKLALQWQSSLKEPNKNQFDLLNSFLDLNSKPANFLYSELEVLTQAILSSETIEKQKVCEILQARYHLEFSPADEIYQMIMAKFFEKEFDKYKINRVELFLKRILDTFCELNFRNFDTYNNFNRLFEYIYNFAPSPYCDEKLIIINFCKKYLGDPRIDQANWAYLNENFNSTYKKLSFWFREQDFDLFFKFVFKNNPDPHGRQAFWKKYLDDIDDIRFFLGTINEYNEFLKLSEENKSSFKPLFNSAGFNAFILKFKLRMGSLYVYDVTEKGNACYVYFVDNSNSIGTSSHVRIASKVSKFLSEVFNSESQIKEFNTKSALVQSDITEQISNKSKQPQGQNWKIVHDANSNWEKLLSTNLLKSFHIKQKKELSDGYR